MMVWVFKCEKDNATILSHRFNYFLHITMLAEKLKIAHDVTELDQGLKKQQTCRFEISFRSMAPVLTRLVNCLTLALERFRVRLALAADDSSASSAILLNILSLTLNFCRTEGKS